jgi:hypothetical protein
MENFVFQIEELAGQMRGVNVQKFALQNARRAIVESQNWGFLENYLIAAYKVNPTVVDIVVELFIHRKSRHNDISLEKVAAFLSSRLLLLSGQRRFGEAMWLLFLAIALGISIPSKSLEGYYGETESTCAVLISDAHSKNLITGKVNFSLWNKSLTTAELDGEMWLYAYESTLKNLNGSSVGDGFIKAHKYFSQLLTKKVEFYRSGKGFEAFADVLHRRKLENSAARKIAADIVDDDLDNELGDWIEEEEDNNGLY